MLFNGRIAALRGKFVFGDIVRGRLFAADVAAMKRADDGIPETVAPVEEIQLYVRGVNGARAPGRSLAIARRTSSGPARRSR